MRPSNYLPSPGAVLFTALASLSLLPLPSLAQGNNNNNNGNDRNPPPGQTPNTSTGRRTTARPASTSSPSPTPTPSTNPADESTSSSSESQPSSSSSSSSSSQTSSPASSATSSSTDTFSDLLTGFPTLTRAPAIPTYPAPSVPPTENAPFMQHSSMPEGTVFIAVGAILGALGVALLLWRTIVSFLLHRSVKRAAMAQHGPDRKSTFPAPPAPFYKYSDQDSSMSLGLASYGPGPGGGGSGGLGAGPGAATGGAMAAGRGVRRTNRGLTPSSAQTYSNLFFSPTASANNAAPGAARGSAFLPSGFYASTSAGTPGLNQTNSISLTNLRPDSRGHYGSSSRASNPSPPDSPPYPATRHNPEAMSTSSLNLGTPQPGRRAPSAYLEDLLAEDHGSLPAPHISPPPGSRNPSAHAHRYSGQPI